MQLLLILYGIPVGISTSLSLLIAWLGRKRVHWRLWELLNLVLPFCVWATTTWLLPSAFTKSWGNFNELFCVGIGLPVAAGLRVAVGSKADETVCAFISTMALCLFSAFVAIFTPNLGGSLG